MVVTRSATAAQKLVRFADEQKETSLKKTSLEAKVDSLPKPSPKPSTDSINKEPEFHLNWAILPVVKAPVEAPKQGLISKLSDKISGVVSSIFTSISKAFAAVKGFFTFESRHVKGMRANLKQLDAEQRAFDIKQAEAKKAAKAVKA